jgi:hypothetical protein
MIQSEKKAFTTMNLFVTKYGTVYKNNKILILNQMAPIIISSFFSSFFLLTGINVVAFCFYIRVEISLTFDTTAKKYQYSEV